MQGRDDLGVVTCRVGMIDVKSGRGHRSAAGSRPTPPARRGRAAWSRGSDYKGILEAGQTEFRRIHRPGRPLVAQRPGQADSIWQAAGRPQLDSRPSNLARP